MRGVIPVCGVALAAGETRSHMWLDREVISPTLAPPHYLLNTLYTLAGLCD